MRFGKLLSLCLVCLGLTVSPGSSASADVLAGEVIDKTNWEKIEGMVPQPILNYVKKGDLAMRVDDLAYDPAEFMTSYDKEHFESNKGKYALNEDDLIIEAQSGKAPDFIEGVPFPEIDVDDPKAAAKLVHNHYYHGFTQGNVVFPYQVEWVGRGGFERAVEGQMTQFPMDGYPPRKGCVNKENIERYSILQILAPFDIAGTNILLWRYRDARFDSTFGYIPAIRRVRRMSPANRSDAYIGTDMCVDDAWCFDGKTTAFTWKLLRKQEGLLPYGFKEVQPFRKTSNACVTTERTPCLELNYERKDAQTAPWFPAGNKLVWTKRPVYVVELKARDPYYNYGKQRLWIDAGNPLVTVFKLIYDRADEYWKNVWLVFSAVATDDDRVRILATPYMLSIDDRADHATLLQGFCKKNIQRYYDALQKERDYSLAGFQRLCK